MLDRQQHWHLMGPIFRCLNSDHIYDQFTLAVDKSFFSVLAAVSFFLLPLIKNLSVSVSSCEA